MRIEGTAPYYYALPFYCCFYLCFHYGYYYDYSLGALSPSGGSVRLGVVNP